MAFKRLAITAAPVQAPSAVEVKPAAFFKSLTPLQMHAFYSKLNPAKVVQIFFDPKLQAGRAKDQNGTVYRFQFKGPRDIDFQKA